ncbi:MAG: HAD hydrolase family protein [bacterium]|nr:HAD hydrolase family protein [bacterium]
MKEKLKKIKLILTDVDGVLTKGEVFFDSQGVELKTWNVRDGLALSIAKRLDDLDIGLITGKTSNSVKSRAENLGIKYVIQGCMNKLEGWSEIKKGSGLQDDEIAYIGDDLIDIPILKLAGVSVCPLDAAPEVFSCVDIVSNIKGGYGVFRDVFRRVLEAQGRWDGIERIFQK